MKKSSIGTDVLPWILVGLSAVIMGVAVSVYSSDASATDSTPASAATSRVLDTAGTTSAIYGPVPDSAEHAAAPQAHPAQL